MNNITSAQIWREIEHNVFAVLGMVTARGEARTVGIVYIIHDHKLYIGTEKTAWKARHVAQNGHVSLTIPIAKRIPFLPWIKIPAATITFAGKARVLDAGEVSAEILTTLFRGMAKDAGRLATSAVIEVTPTGDFITYGVGVRLLKMRDPKSARGRAPT